MPARIISLLTPLTPLGVVVALVALGVPRLAWADEDVGLIVDGLELRFVTRFTPAYADHGTGAKARLSTWKPEVPPGFFKLGDLATAGHGRPDGIVIVVRPIDVDAVSAPDDYERIYADNGSGGAQDGSFWKPVCTIGYVGLGLIAQGSHRKPSLSEMVCVQRKYTTFARVGDRIWDNKGSGARQQVTVWDVEPAPIPPLSRATSLTSGSFVAHPSYHDLHAAPTARALTLTIPHTPLEATARPPQLIRREVPVRETAPVLVDRTRVPSLAVNDPALTRNRAQQAAESPVYVLERHAFHRLHDHRVNEAAEDAALDFKATVGMSAEHRAAIGSVLRTSEAKGSGGAIRGTGAKVILTLAWAFDGRPAVGQAERVVEQAWPVKAGTAAALYTLSYRYLLKRTGRGGAEIARWDEHTDTLHLATWAPVETFEAIDVP